MAQCTAPAQGHRTSSGAAFRGVDIDAIIADLLRRFPDMDQYERDHLLSAAVIWKARLDMISPDDVAKVILR